MAERLHLSERGIALILGDLGDRYVESRREGRRIYYSVFPTKPLRSDLLRLLAETETSRPAPTVAAQT